MSIHKSKGLAFPFVIIPEIQKSFFTDNISRMMIDFLINSLTMKLEKTYIPDLILIKPDVHKDNRGYFFESFRHDLLEEELGYEVNFIQDNESKSTKGVLRGLHYQVPPFVQSKLVRVIAGNVLDVVVDIRKNSPTFAKHFSIELSGDNKYQLFIPSGCAHAFLTLSKEAIFSYKVDNFYNKN